MLGRACQGSDRLPLHVTHKVYGQAKESFPSSLHSLGELTSGQGHRLGSQDPTSVCGPFLFPVRLRVFS